MKKWLIAAGIIIAGGAVYLFAAMSDSDAMWAAFKIWGDNAAISRTRKFGAVGWTYQVGCIDSTSGAFIVAGSAKLSWDAALATVNMAANGPHQVQAIARLNDGTQVASDPVTVFACNPMATAAQVAMRDDNARAPMPGLYEGFRARTLRIRADLEPPRTDRGPRHPPFCRCLQSVHRAFH